MNRSPGRFAQLDTLRAFAVGIVMIHHFRDQPFIFSGFGSVLFLVLSGYFATKTLLRLRGEVERGDSEGVFALKSFYFQRCLRLFPLYYLVLFLTLLLGVKYAHSSFWWNALFLSNFKILLTGEWDGRFSPLWSLSLLEQFYLIWPALMLFAPRNRLVPLAVGTILIAPVYRLVCLGGHFGPIAWSVAPFASMDQLGSGALLALCTSNLASRALRDSLLAIAGKICVPLFTVVMVCKAWQVNLPGCAIYINLVASLAFVWLIRKAETGFEGNVRILLENPVLGYIGRISYSIFLLHSFSELFVPHVGIFKHLMHSDLRAYILIPVSLLLAHCAYQFIEYPIQCFRKKHLPTAKPQPILGSLVIG